MKDLKFPEIDRNKSEESWRNLKLGDKVVLIEWNMWKDSYYINYFEVIKITPKGNIRLSNNELIKIDSCNSYKYYVPTKEIKEWINKIILEQKVLSLIYDIRANEKGFKINTTYEEYLKLKELLEDKLKVSDDC